MKKIIAFVFLFLSLWANAQNEQLAQNYFDRGEFEKALVSYEDLLKVSAGNSLYFQRVVECYQQLQQFDKAEKALQARLDKYKQSNLLVELGYNYQLQKDDEKAKKYFVTIASIKNSCIFALAINNRPVRLSVRTPGFHPGKRGSIPLRATTIQFLLNFITTRRIMVRSSRG